MEKSYSDGVISATKIFVKDKLAGAESGHDWFHVERVWRLSKKIQDKEGGNLLVIELAALLHDVADPKFHNGDEDLAVRISKNFLESQNLAHELIGQILFIIKNISFKNRAEMPAETPLELKIVQDADRLDALGAIGIARAFNFGGYKNNVIYDPEVPAKTLMNKEEYKKSNGTTINHFYEKLLLLKDLMNTDTAREIAARRHQFLLDFLVEFLLEWDAG